MNSHAPHDPPFDDDRPDTAPTKIQYRVMTPIRDDRRGRPGQKPKTFWHHVGMAWENPATDTRGVSITIRLNSLPISNELVLFVDEGRPEDRGDGGSSDRT